MSSSRSKLCFSGAVTFLGDRGGFCEKSHIICKQLQPTFQGWWRTFFLCHTVTWNLSGQQERAWSELLLYVPQSGWRLKVYFSIPLGLDPLGLAAFGPPSLLFLSPSPGEEMLPFSSFLGQSTQQTIFVLSYGTVRSLMLLLHHISSLFCWALRFDYMQEYHVILAIRWMPCSTKLMGRSGFKKWPGSDDLVIICLSATSEVLVLPFPQVVTGAIKGSLWLGPTTGRLIKGSLLRRPCCVSYKRHCTCRLSSWWGT